MTWGAGALSRTGGGVGRPAFPYRVTAVIPLRDTPDLLRLCIRFLERQTERPYIMVVDTGSRDELLHGVLAMRGEGTEVHSISCHGPDQAMASVSFAMDLALAACRTEWLWCLRSDCFMTNREALTVMLSRAEGGANPVVGYEMPPSHNGDQRGMISHTCTLFHVPTLDRLNVTWSMRRFARQDNDANGHLPPSPETVVNHRLHDAGVTPVLLGSERAHGVEIDAHRVHLRAATARRIGLAKEAGDEAAERSIVDWLERLSESDDGAPDAAPPPGIVADALRPVAADSARRPAVWTSAEAGARGRPEQTDTICLARGQPILFKHGLGDAVTFAHSIPLYTARRHAVRIACAPDKEIIFRAAGAEIVDESEARFIHVYPYPEKIPQIMPRDWLPCNKLWHSISHPPMPDIGRDRSLWREYCDVRLDLDPFVTSSSRESLDAFLGRLPKPLILFHPQGSPPFERRTLRADVAEAICRRLLADTDGSVVTLDWAGQRGKDEWSGWKPIVADPRVISLCRDWKPLDVAEFYWVLKHADLFIGIDSGPAHCLRFTDTPGVVCWTKQRPPFGVPAYCALPRPLTMNVVPRIPRRCDAEYGTAYNIVQSSNNELLDGDFIAEQAINLLHAQRSRILADAEEPHDCTLMSAFEATPALNNFETAESTVGVFRVRCIGARGDVLAACAVAGAVKRKYPDRRVVLETGHPYVADGNPFIDSVVAPGTTLQPAEQLLDLDPDADWRPRDHRLARFAEIAGASLDDLQFFIRKDPVDQLPDSYIVIHAGPTADETWKGRNWLPERWTELAKRIMDDGTAVVVVGDDSTIQMPQEVLDLRGKTSLHQTAFVIDRASALVGIESLPAVVAQCLGVPCVLFFGSILPELRVFRDNVIAVSDARLPCIGCHHNETRPIITFRCRVNGEPCQQNVSVGTMLTAARQAINLRRSERVILYSRAPALKPKATNIRPTLKLPSGAGPAHTKSLVP